MAAQPSRGPPAPLYLTAAHFPDCRELYLVHEVGEGGTWCDGESVMARV